MGTSVAETTSGGGYQPPSGSLQEAQSRFAGLLSKEETQPAKTQPEQSPTTEDTSSKAAASATEQAPAAAETESEQAPPSEQQEPEATPVTTTYKAKINGQEVEVTLEEALKGYSRTEDYTRKTQQLAEERKAFAEKQAAVDAERQRYATNLERLEQAIKDVTPDEPNWDLRRLQVTPDALAQEMLNWRENTKRLEAIRAERLGVEQIRQRDMQAQMEQRLEQEKKLLIAALPSFADPTDGPALRNSLYEFAKGKSFSDDEIASATTDHRVVLLINAAMQWEKAQANKPKVENKIAAALATPAPQNRTPAAPRNKLAEAKSRLKESGRVEDAAAAFYQLLD